MLEELRTFIAVVEHKNFTKAAQEIRLSQPSVSLHIKHLEEYFQVNLIKRSNKQKKIFITDEGKLLYERAKQITNLIEETALQLKNRKNIISGNLRIGASFTIGEYVLPAFLSEFTKEYENISFEVSIKNTAEICNMVKNLELDIGLIEGIVPTSQFHYESFCKDEIVLAIPYNHPLANEEIASFDKLQNNVWISRERGSGTKEYLDFFLSSNNIKAKNILVFGSNNSVREAVKNEMGITIISSYVTQNAVGNNEIKVVSLPKTYTRQFSYILNDENVITKSIQVFIEKLKQYGQNNSKLENRN